MKISKEFTAPLPPPCEYHLVLTAEEFQVLRAAVAVAKFPDVRDKLKKSSPIIIEKSDDVLYKMHSAMYNYDYR